MRELVPFARDDVRELAQELAERIVQFYRERPDSIALIPRRDKEGRIVAYVPEITRPLALMLWQYLIRYISGKGGSLVADAEVLYADSDRVVVKAVAVLEIGGQKFQFVEVGEAVVEGEYDDTVARRAYTRAFKRLMEQVIGEDFINRTVLSLVESKEETEEVKTNGKTAVERPATSKQLEILKDFIKKGKLTREHVKELIKEGKLPEDFDLTKAVEEGSLTDMMASELLHKAGLIKRR